MSGLPTLLALFSRPDGGAARDPDRHGRLAQQRSQGVRGLLTLQAPFANTDGCADRPSSGMVMRRRSYAMAGQLALLTLLARADGRTVGHHVRHDGMALQHSWEMTGLPELLALCVRAGKRCYAGWCCWPVAQANGSTVGEHIRHDGMTPHRSKET